MAAKVSIWSNSFKKGGVIEKTTVKNGMQDKVVKSSINTSGRATISYAVSTAIMAVVQGMVNAAKTAVGIWCECRSHTVPGRRYVLHYNTTAKTMDVFVAENMRNVVADVVNDDFAHWSLFVPRIIEILDGDGPQGEFTQSFAKVVAEFQASGMVSNCRDELFILNDYLYESRHQAVQKNDEITIVQPFSIIITDDLSDKIGAKKGDFEFVAVNNAQSSKKKTGQPSANNPTPALDYALPWSAPLSADEERLVPKYDLAVMTISDWMHKLAKMVKGEYDSETKMNNILLYGEAGAGKSTAAKLLAQMWGLPYRFLNLSLNSEESDLIGHYRPQADGTFKFYEPAFAETYRNGGVVELMEPNYARPGALGVLNSALDDTAKITLGNGEVVERHPNCIIMFTTNVDYEGTQRMNQALKDRFQQMALVDKLPNTELIKIAMRGSGNTDAKLVAKMVDAVQKISVKMINEQISGGVCSTRQLINWARDVKYTGDPVESAKTTILPGVSLDLEVQKDIMDKIIRNMF